MRLWTPRGDHNFPVSYSYIYSLNYIIMCGDTCTHALMHARWACGGQENSLWELFISFHHVGPRYWTQNIRLGSKYFHPQSHLTSPGVHNFLELGLAARMIGVCFGDSCSHSSSRNRLTFSFNLSGYTFADSHLNVFPRRPVQGHPSAECGRLTLAVFVIFLLMRWNTYQKRDPWKGGFIWAHSLRVHLPWRERHGMRSYHICCQSTSGWMRCLAPCSIHSRILAHRMFVFCLL